MIGLPCRLPQQSLLLLTFVACHVAAQDAQEAKGWLERMNRAVEELSYEGTFVHVHGGTGETLQIVHRNEDGSIAERILSLDGVGREIIRREDEVQCILPDSRVVLLQQRKELNPLASALPSYTEDLDASYELTLHSTARVAQRSAQVLGIMPKDDYRYGYTLWLDEETAMPLKSQLTDENGEVVEQILFTQLDILDHVPPEALEPTTDTEGFTWLRPPPLPADSGVVLWRVENLPGGFRLSAATRGPIAGSEHPVEHLVYSDGLATVSVFIEDPQTKPELSEGFSKVGSTNAFSVTVRGRRVTAVGEVPRHTVRSIATSLQPQ